MLHLHILSLNWALVLRKDLKNHHWEAGLDKRQLIMLTDIYYLKVSK